LPRPMLNINWEWAHLASDDKPGPNGKNGFFLGDKIHWQLSQSAIKPGAQLIKIGGKDVKNWEHSAVKAYLDQFLRDDDGPVERELTFVNQPITKAKAPSKPPVVNPKPKPSPSPAAKSSKDRKQRSNNNAGNGSVNSNDVRNAGGPGSSPNHNQDRRGRSASTERKPQDYNRRDRNERSKQNQGGPALPNDGGGFGNRAMIHERDRDFGAPMEFGGRDFGETRYGNVTYRGRGRGYRGQQRGRGYRGNAYRGGASYRGSNQREYRRGGHRGGFGPNSRRNDYDMGPDLGGPGSPSKSWDVRSMSEQPDYILNQIVETLACPMKPAYAVKDVVWVDLSKGTWCLCVVKFVNANAEDVVVRPLGKSEQYEVHVTPSQLHAAPPPKALSVSQVRQCLEALKGEIDYQFRVSNAGERDLWQGAMVKYRDNAYGHVMKKHSDNNYSVVIKKECKWFRGQRKLRMVHRSQLELADEMAFKFEALRFDTAYIKDGPRARRVFNGHSEDVCQVYDFLGDIRDRYIFRLLENGYDKLKYLLEVGEKELEEMGFRLGHRKHVMRLIRDFDAEAFAEMRRQKNKEKAKAKKEKQNEKNEKKEASTAAVSTTSTTITTTKWRQKQPTPEKEKSKTPSAPTNAASNAAPAVEPVSGSVSVDFRPTKILQRTNYPSSPSTASSESRDDAEVAAAAVADSGAANSEQKDVGDHDEYTKMMQLAFYTFAGHQPWAKVTGLYMYKKDLSRFLEILHISDSVEDVFALIDSDVRDGKVTMTEWMDYFTNAEVNPSAPQIRAHIAQQTSWRLLVKSLQIFERVDADRSGKLEYGEFVEFGDLIGLNDSETEVLWTKMDENESGSIDIVELFRWFSARLYAQRRKQARVRARNNDDVSDSSESAVTDHEEYQKPQARYRIKEPKVETDELHEHNIAADANADIAHVDDDEKVIV